MTVREKTQEIERMTLSPYARLSERNAGRPVPEEPDELRTDFQRDRDRIIHCKAFRRLKQKTQVFLSPEGDHYRTRLTHTLEVSQIARTIARSLRLNEDLTEAIALGHDLGHTPFGHAGERALDKLNPEGFHHYIQSVRVVTRLEKGFRGLNLTRDVLNGFATHTKGEWAFTMEGRVVRYADRIAYMNHDIEDAIMAGVLSPGALPESVVRVLGDTKSKRISCLILDLVKNSGSELRMSPEVAAEYETLHQFMYDSVYIGSKAKQEEYKVERLITELYHHFLREPGNLPEEYQAIARQEGIHRAVTDYISGMSDEFATHCFENLFIPQKWQL
ncbi:MAG: deoxyguanosinetriphosphate triphosphohydrolase [Oscillospiraceae bacterium]|nr:deoxyguanosinetriphosphate triphosphohydrolase [Oscillospiraceae bacterium]